MIQKRNQLVLGTFAICVSFIVVFGLGCTTHAEYGNARTEKQVTFTYAPPDGTKFVQTVAKTREILIEGLGRRVERSESQTSLMIRRVESGYVIAVTPLSMTMTRNGAPVSNSVIDFMVDVVSTYHVGQDGYIERIEGFAGLKERIQESFSPKVAAALAPLLNEQAMVARSTAEWNAKIGDYVGVSFAMGETKTRVLPFEMRNGEIISYYNHVSFSEWEPCPAGSCVRVEVNYDSDARALAKASSSITTETLEKLTKGDPAGDSSDPRMSGTASWLVDPTTMLFYGQTLSQTMSMMLQIPGSGAIKATIKEDRFYSYDYN